MTPHLYSRYYDAIQIGRQANQRPKKYTHPENSAYQKLCLSRYILSTHQRESTSRNYSLRFFSHICVIIRAHTRKREYCDEQLSCRGDMDEARREMTHALINVRQRSLPSLLFIHSSSSLMRPVCGAAAYSGKSRSVCSKISSSYLFPPCVSPTTTAKEREERYLVSFNERGGIFSSRFQ
jgi:hypothetical protein